jgi:predicted CopG family antitoxin
MKESEKRFKETHTTITLSNSNYNRLKELGYTSESFDIVISRVLDKLESLNITRNDLTDV